MTNRIFRAVLAPTALLFAAACVDLEVKNPNAPDIARALGSPDDVVSVASSGIYSWYMAASHYEPNLPTQVTADGLTANYGNFGMRFNNVQPRIPYNNNSASGDRLVAQRPWGSWYSAIGAANDALSAIEAGVVVPGGTEGEERVRSAILFTQAAAHTSLGLLFDQAFVVTSAPVGTLPTLQPYGVVLDSALAVWDRLIALTDGKTWEWPASWFPNADVPMTAGNINRIAKTMAARVLVLGARTGAENTGPAGKWAQVLAYADEGITGTGLSEFDIGVTDDYNVWWDYTKNLGNDDGWTRVDQRLINRMDPDIPVNFDGLTNQAVSTPNDNRLGVANLAECNTDPVTPECVAGLDNFDYLDIRTVIGSVARGIYMQSPFIHNRYRNSSFAVEAIINIGRKVPFVLTTENDLMIAEALVESGGDLTRAAALVNKTRVTRGGLAPVAADAAALRAAINYERDVELLNTGGITLFDRRRFEGLQAGTWRHLPVPARELEVLALPVYTFGGVGLPDM